ncbi:T6SS immunity protein Tdi1 domain-containing protein [Rubrivivax albus]|uniref:DUF1851 domain-containing protein n=1 Tax=Rubrivivax albus TaxID=2499835 RepID=A0A437JQ84_9BURK|nr:T6SS immunity protein Tdi1 domain-containing protein [Rubrivivax albus]RVT48933.1 DUF1851 domain-containing protein [Rubrivivax albus]
MTDTDTFWAGSAFDRMWGAGPVRRPAQDSELARHAARVDPLITAFWRRYGWGLLGSGLLVAQPPAELESLYGRWRLPAGRVPVLRSAWGHLLSVDGDASYLLDPLYGDERTLGCDGVTALDALLVVDALLDDDLLRPAFRDATVRIGRPPNIDECLGFVPALRLGGRPDAETAAIGALAATLDLLAQL